MDQHSETGQCEVCQRDGVQVQRVRRFGNLGRARVMCVDERACLTEFIVEAARVNEYNALISGGLSDYEARETVWPQSSLPEQMDVPCRRKTGWLSGESYCATHGRSAGWPCSTQTEGVE